MSNLEQFGEVVELKGDQRALVRVRQHLSCGSCGRCGGFFGDPGKRKDHLVEVLNPIGAKKGELVRLEARVSEMLLAAFLLYIVPLLGLLAGLFAGRSFALHWGVFGSPDLWGLLWGLVFMFFFYFLLRSQERHLARSRRFKAVITAVVEPGDIPEEARLD